MTAHAFGGIQRSIGMAVLERRLQSVLCDTLQIAERSCNADTTVRSLDLARWRGLRGSRTCLLTLV